MKPRATTAVAITSDMLNHLCGPVSPHPSKKRYQRHAWKVSEPAGFSMHTVKALEWWFAGTHRSLAHDSWPPPAGGRPRPSRSRARFAHAQHRPARRTTRPHSVRGRSHLGAALGCTTQLSEHKRRQPSLPCRGMRHTRRRQSFASSPFHWRSARESAVSTNTDLLQLVRVGACALAGWRSAPAGMRPQVPPQLCDHLAQYPRVLPLGHLAEFRPGGSQNMRCCLRFAALDSYMEPRKSHKP